MKNIFFFEPLQPDKKLRASPVGRPVINFYYVDINYIILWFPPNRQQPTLLPEEDNNSNKNKQQHGGGWVNHFSKRP